MEHPVFESVSEFFEMHCTIKNRPTQFQVNILLKDLQNVIYYTLESIDLNVPFHQKRHLQSSDQSLMRFQFIKH